MNQMLAPKSNVHVCQSLLHVHRSSILEMGKLKDIELDDEITRLIQELKDRTGQDTSQVLTQAVKSYVKSFETLRMPSNEIISEIADTIEQIIGDHMMKDIKAIPSQTHEDHSYITKGLIHMMQNKIFPVVFVINKLRAQSSAKKNKEWMNFDAFKNLVYKNAKDHAEKLSGTMNKKFQTGLPITEINIGRKLKPGWTTVKRSQETEKLSNQSKNRFITNFVGEVNHSKNWMDGAPASWGLIEVKILQSGERSGSEWVRLTELGKEFGDVFDLKYPFTLTSITWLFENIFKKFPLEYEAMLIMLKDDQIGNKHEQRGTRVLAESFYKIQVKYLTKLMNTQELNSKKAEYQKAIDGLKGKETLIKKKGEPTRIKFEKYYVPKMRANAVMTRLQEMGLFQINSEGTVYNRTELGKKVFKKLNKK